jgi:LmbE family N-acetylglucosaminyl deacetylase
MRVFITMRMSLLLAVVLTSACASRQPTTPPVVGCDNAQLTRFDGLLIIAPHPDDEVLGFAGLADAFIAQGKPVRTVVVTDGDAYCEACALWTTGSVSGGTCDAKTLSNLATPEIDSLAETRRSESTAAAAALGRPAPEFLAYPDTGLAAARSNVAAGDPGKWLRRSDFSHCTSCGDCAGGYGGGPETRLSADTLIDSLDRLIGATPKGTLIATTHWLDGHGDHAALGAFVGERAALADGGRTVAFAVIHANSAGGHAYADCWYPEPAATDCPCFDNARADSDPAWLASLRAHRERPDWPQTLPSDADYGDAVQLCLGDEARRAKPEAISAFATQLGTIGRAPGILPPAREGILDCSAYLRSFGRRTEVFVVKRLHEQ